ncbi:MAG: hypothetical protein JJU10_10835 [Idiomarina sp.]|nr:hypothetical protein [Idiomarina sp.]
MNINASLIGQTIVISAVVIGLVSYYLGRRKTETPVLAGLLGFVLGIIPFVGIIYLVVLMFKRDIATVEAAESVESSKG